MFITEKRTVKNPEILDLERIILEAIHRMQIKWSYSLKGTSLACVWKAEKYLALGRVWSKDSCDVLNLSPSLQLLVQPSSVWASLSGSLLPSIDSEKLWDYISPFLLGNTNSKLFYLIVATEVLELISIGLAWVAIPFLQLGGRNSLLSQAEENWSGGRVNNWNM